MPLKREEPNNGVVFARSARRTASPLCGYAAAHAGRCLCAQTRYPIARPPRLMSDGNYNQRVACLDDDDVEGESVEKQSPGSEGTCFARNLDEWERILAEEGESVLEGIEKPTTGSRRFCVVPGGGLFKLSGGLCLDTNSAHQVPFSRRRARASTSSGSMSVAFPARNSLIRPHNSTSQACSASGSAGPSRLAKRSRASSALSSRGRAIAFSRMFSKALVLIIGHPSGAAGIVPQATAHNKLPR